MSLGTLLRVPGLGVQKGASFSPNNIPGLEIWIDYLSSPKSDGETNTSVGTTPSVVGGDIKTLANLAAGKSSNFYSNAYADPCTLRAGGIEILSSVQGSSGGTQLGPQTTVNLATIAMVLTVTDNGDAVSFWPSELDADPIPTSTEWYTGANDTWRSHLSGGGSGYWYSNGVDTNVALANSMHADGVTKQYMIVCPGSTVPDRGYLYNTNSITTAGCILRALLIFSTRVSVENIAKLNTYLVGKY